MYKTNFATSLLMAIRPSVVLLNNNMLYIISALSYHHIYYLYETGFEVFTYYWAYEIDKKTYFGGILAKLFLGIMD